MWNLPNTVTVVRLGCCLIVFLFLSQQMYVPALWLFVFAAGTDWLDGFLARRLNQVTQVGRILDPFADKMLVCGTFIFLIVVPVSGVQPWMAALVLARELLVTVLRSFLEQRSADFSATWSGKLKMVLQLVPLILGLWLATQYATADQMPEFWANTQTLALWAAMLITLISGVDYVVRAARLTREMGGSET